MAQKTTTRKSKKTRRIVQHAKVHVQASFNNTIVTVSDLEWKTLTWASGWSSWFKWARESTPYAAQITSESALERAQTLHWVESVDVFLKGIWVWREQAVRWIISKWIDIKWIYDITPIPHNGCRKKKVRKL